MDIGHAEDAGELDVLLRREVESSHEHDAVLPIGLAQLLALSVPDGFRVESVYLDAKGGRKATEAESHDRFLLALWSDSGSRSVELEFVSGPAYHNDASCPAPSIRRVR